MRDFLSTGTRKSIQDLWTVSEPVSLQHHQGRRSFGVLSGSHRTARLQAQTIQDQDTRMNAHGVA